MAYKKWWNSYNYTLGSNSKKLMNPNEIFHLSTQSKSVVNPFTGDIMYKPDSRATSQYGSPWNPNSILGKYYTDYLGGRDIGQKGVNTLGSYFVKAPVAIPSNQYLTQNTSETPVDETPVDKYAPFNYMGRTYDFDNPQDATDWAVAKRSEINNAYDRDYASQNKYYGKQQAAIAKNLSDIEKNKNDWFTDYGWTMNDLGQNLWNKNAQTQNYYSQISPEAYQSAAGTQINANNQSYNRGLQDAQRQRTNYLGYYNDELQNQNDYKGELSDWYNRYKTEQELQRTQDIDAINNAIMGTGSPDISYSVGNPFKSTKSSNINAYKGGGLNVTGAYNSLGIPGTSSKYTPIEGTTTPQIQMSAQLRDIYNRYVNGLEVSAQDMQTLSDYGLI